MSANEPKQPNAIPMTDIRQLITKHLDIWSTAQGAKKSGRGRAASSAGSVYGVQKLRELILELAVRGKLVAQDENDEPASELIKQARELHVATTKTKKIKQLSSLSNDANESYTIPESWEWVCLPEVAEYKVGKTPSTKVNAYWSNADNNDFHWVSIADLNHDGVVENTSKKITEIAKTEVFKGEPVPVGTILMSFKLTLGKISILKVPAFHNEAIISIFPKQLMLKDFLFKILPAIAKAGDSKSAIKGNTLNSESIAALLIPLPPINEQHRIVAKVDELMSLCDQLEAAHNDSAQAHEQLVGQLLDTLTQSQDAADFSERWQRIAAHFDTLFTTETSIDALKQTVLQLAVMGKLVPQDPNDEVASELVKRIAIEKIDLILDGKQKKSKGIPDVDEDEKPFELPIRWTWARLQDIYDVRDGTHDTPKYQNKGFPLVTSKNLYSGKLDLSDIKYISKEDHAKIKERSKVDQGDILFAMIGSIGNPVMVDVDIEFSIKNVALFKPYKAHLSNLNYLLLYLNMASIDLRNKAAGAVQSFVSLGALRNYLIPVPPLAEQHRIVAKVDELMALCDALKSRIADAARMQQQLADVLTAQAVAQV